MHIGICDVYETKHEVRCRRAFPPTQDLITIVRQSLEDRHGSGERQFVDSSVSSWNATLSNISPSVLRDKEARFASESKASIALVTLALILDALLLSIPSISSGRLTRCHYLAPAITSLLAIAGGTLAILATNDGVKRAVNTSEHGGPALIVLFVGAGLRLLSAAVGCCFCVGSNEPERTPVSASRPESGYQEPRGSEPLRDTRTKDERNKDLGYEGEFEVLAPDSILVHCAITDLYFADISVIRILRSPALVPPQLD
jgi:hypothetical protein